MHFKEPSLEVSVIKSISKHITYRHEVNYQKKSLKDSKVARVFVCLFVFGGGGGDEALETRILFLI